MCARVSVCVCACLCCSVSVPPVWDGAGCSCSVCSAFAAFTPCASVAATHTASLRDLKQHTSESRNQIKSEQQSVWRLHAAPRCHHHSARRRPPSVESVENVLTIYDTLMAFSPQKKELLIVKTGPPRGSGGVRGPGRDESERYGRTDVTSDCRYTL